MLSKFLYTGNTNNNTTNNTNNNTNNNNDHINFYFSNKEVIPKNIATKTWKRIE